MKKKNIYKEFNKILIGLEYIFSDDIISKTRLALQKIDQNFHEDPMVWNIFFDLLDSLKDYPVTTHLRDILCSNDSEKKTLAILDFYEFFYQNPNLNQELVNSLKDSPVTTHLRDILCSNDSEKKTLAILDFYEFFYQNPNLNQELVNSLKDSPVTPHLRDILCSNDSEKKTLAILDFYEFFYQNPNLNQELVNSLKDSPVTPHLRDILCSNDSEKKTLAILDFYEFFYQNPNLNQELVNSLKDSPVTPHLRDILCSNDSEKKTLAILDFYEFFYQNPNLNQELVNSLKDSPVTPHLRDILCSNDSEKKTLALLDFYEFFYQNPNLNQELVNSLKDSPVTTHLRDILYSNDSEKKTLALLDFYEFFYQNPNLNQELVNSLKDSPVTPHLRDILCSNDSEKKTLAILDFYEFLHSEDLLLQSFKKACQHFFSQGSSLQFLNFLQKATGRKIFNQIKVIQEKYESFPIIDSFSKGQILSKLMARNCLMDLNLDSHKTAMVLCGWSGVLSNLLLEKLFHSVVSIDKDPDCEPVAIRMNYEYYIKGRFNAITKNIFDIKYKKPKLIINKFSTEKINQFDIIINTSCEHIEDFQKWYKLLPEGQLLLLQSNNFFDIKEHVNCVASLEAFKEMAPMRRLLLSRQLHLEKYTRFILIGYK